MSSLSVREPGSKMWAAALVSSRARPALADGAELIGEFESSGYREPPALIRRGDGQVVRLHPLLFEVASQLDGRQRLSAVAGAVERETGTELTADQVGYLVDNKLAPLGISTYCDGSPPAVAKADPFLRLRFRIGVIPERATNFVGSLFGWLHHPIVVFLGVLAAVISEGWLLTYQNVSAVVGQVLTMPSGMLVAFGLAVASTAFHEIGHASACRYSGVRPGKMGCGIYIAWPVFYTDITDSYRLGRAGRLRTDLGGIYFNGLFIAALIAGFWLSGFAPLAIAVLMINLEIIQQLLPSIRFDAYYIVSDLIGVPDLFRYIAPMVKRVLRRKPDERLDALKRFPKTMIGIWVFGIVPVGLAEMGMLIWHLPQFVATTEQTARGLLHTMQAAAGNGNLIGLTSASLQMLSAVLPLVGIGLLAFRALIGAAKITYRRLHPGTVGTTRVVAARGRHAGVPSRGTWGTGSRGRHAADRYRGARRVTAGAGIS
jgi:putative peptide zinc metalloprotease protein